METGCTLEISRLGNQTQFFSIILKIRKPPKASERNGKPSEQFDESLTLFKHTDLQKWSFNKLMLEPDDIFLHVWFFLLVVFIELLFPWSSSESCFWLKQECLCVNTQWNMLNFIPLRSLKGKVHVSAHRRSLPLQTTKFRYFLLNAVTYGPVLYLLSAMQLSL